MERRPRTTRLKTGIFANSLRSLIFPTPIPMTTGSTSQTRRTETLSRDNSVDVGLCSGSFRHPPFPHRCPFQVAYARHLHPLRRSVVSYLRSQPQSERYPHLQDKAEPSRPLDPLTQMPSRPQSDRTQIHRAWSPKHRVIRPSFECYRWKSVTIALHFTTNLAKKRHVKLAAPST
ncbi:hypothetical protein BKA70DRAFT_525770 [Coprinopsis sp. MPI-PUGE-AT-0042]|nr:hypothetical protein BKA70DRAFT_525770 [Coprinopsis sp. MPI-PUGE-AT-0042]